MMIVAMMTHSGQSDCGAVACPLARRLLGPDHIRPANGFCRRFGICGGAKALADQGKVAETLAEGATVVAAKWKNGINDHYSGNM